MKTSAINYSFFMAIFAVAICKLSFGNQWRAADGGAFMDNTRWNPQSVPSASSEQAWWYSDAQGSYTVTLPTGDWTNEAQWRVDVRNQTTKFKFDGGQTVWTQTTHDVADYIGEPFAFYDLVGHFFSFEMYSDKKGAPFRFTHPVFRAEGTNGISALHFDSGTFNFYNPTGVAHNYDFTVSYGANEATLIGVHGADVSVANVNVRSRSALTTLLVDGGSLDAKTKLDVPTASGGDERTEVDVVVTNSGTLRAGYVVFGYNGKPRDFKVKVADGGRFELPIPDSYKFSQQTGGSTLDWEVSNGGTVYLGHNLAFAWGDGTVADVHLDRGNWLSYNETTIGSDSEGSTCMFAATNSFIDTWQGNASAMLRLNQDMIVKDSLWTNNYLYAYGANCSPSLLVNGGRWVNLSRIYFGTPNGAEMTIDGGAHEWNGQIYVGYEANKVGTVTFKAGSVVMSSGEMIALGYNGVGVFNIDGGEISMPGGGGLSIGHTLSGTGSVRMTAGRLSVPVSETGIVVGRYGKGTFLMEGGNIALGKGLWLGHVSREVSDAYKAYFHQTGGSVVAGYVNLCHGNAKGEVALDGGTFEVGYIESQGGSTAAGGSGNATLSADGGTIVPKFSSTGFIKKIDGIVLGNSGLVIDTAYDISIDNVPVTSKSGTNGRLVKRGVGTLTLDCDVADDVEIVVEGGKVVFGQTDEIGALTIGSATSAGAIELAAGVALTVKGVVNVIHNSSIDEFEFVAGEGGVTEVRKDDSAARALEINLDRAEVSNATETVLFRAKDTLTATVVSGGTLNLSGHLARGAFVKAGTGKAVLNDAGNEFYGGVSLRGGTLSFGSVAALGLSLVEGGAVALNSGTLEYLSETSGSTAAGIRLVADSAQTPVVVKTAGDITFNGGFEATSGALVKGGAGELTVKAVNNRTIVVSGAGNGTGANGAPQNMASFSSDGSFTGEHGALTVAEGTLTIKGTGSETVNTSGGLIAVGVQMENVSAQPMLKVDGATLDNNMHLFVGGFVQPNSASGWATNAALEIVNGGTVKCDTLRMGFQSGSRGNYPFVHVDGGVLDVGFRVNCADHASNVHAKYLFENGASYKVGSYNYSSWQTYWEGDAEFVFDNSNYDIAGNNHYGYLHLRNSGRGSMLFRNGAKAYVADVEKISGDNHVLTLAFDDGAWIPSAGDYDFFFRGGEAITVDCREGGLHLPVPNGATWTVHQKMSGAGGIFKEGEGTLIFDSAAYSDTYHGERNVWADTASWAFNGVARVKAGRLEVKNGACPATAALVVDAGAVFSPGSELEFGEISGPGTISGGGLIGAKISGVTVDGTSLTRPRIALTVDGAGGVTGQPKFVACSFNGTVMVDFGRSEDDPLPERGTAFTLCTFEGAVPEFGRVKAVNTGINAAEIRLYTEGNSVLGRIRPGGFKVIVR